MSNSQRGIESSSPAKQDMGDVVNLALQGVRANADAHNAARKSPKKIYSGVRSKVAGNIKSIKKAQTRSTIDKAKSAAKNGETAGAYSDISPTKNTAASSNGLSR
jgi:hypothetical protein